jgi:hypothetical protein
MKILSEVVLGNAVLKNRMAIAPMTLQNSTAVNKQMMPNLLFL